jgi:hypothetical protein
MVSYPVTSSISNSAIYTVTTATPTITLGDMYAALGSQLWNFGGQQYALGNIASAQWQYNNAQWQYQIPRWSWRDVEDGQQHADLMAKLAAEDAKRLAKRKAAALRAESLLFTILTPAQVKSYKDDGFFEQEVNERIYRIRSGRARNVELIEAGKVTALYCAHPSDAYDCPVPDVMLSQLLALRANEAEFLRIANRTVMQ